MLGIVIATCGAPALSGFITGKDMACMWYSGWNCICSDRPDCLTILGHNLKKKNMERSRRTMALVTMKELLERAKNNHRGIGAFSVGNMEMVKGAIQAAEELTLRSSCRLQK